MKISKAIFISAAMILLSLSTTVGEVYLAHASETAKDPKALIGRWEGHASSGAYWNSDYALEIFSINAKTKEVTGRQLCTNCFAGYTHRYFTGRLTDDGNKIAFEALSVSFTLNENRLKGVSSYTQLAHTYYSDYYLTRMPDKMLIQPSELVGEWIYDNKKWRELNIDKIDYQNRTFTGKYKTKGGNEYDLQEAKIVSHDDRLIIDFTTAIEEDAASHLQLVLYPAFGEYPPVLFGTLERDGKVYLRMFKKKVRKE